MRCNGAIKTATSPSRCSKKASVFYRVKYSKLWVHRDNGIYEDTVGFCPECSVGKDKLSGYDSRRSIWRVRGEIESVSPCGQPETSENRRQKIHDLKARILRIMGQSNVSDVSDDEWQQIFELARHEFILKSVHGS